MKVTREKNDYRRMSVRLVFTGKDVSRTKKSGEIFRKLLSNYDVWILKLCLCLNEHSSFSSPNDLLLLRLLLLRCLPPLPLHRHRCRCRCPYPCRYPNPCLCPCPCRYPNPCRYPYRCRNRYRYRYPCPNRYRCRCPNPRLCVWVRFFSWHQLEIDRDFRRPQRILPFLLPCCLERSIEQRRR